MVCGVRFHVTWFLVLEIRTCERMAARKRLAVLAVSPQLKPFASGPEGSGRFQEVPRGSGRFSEVLGGSGGGGSEVQWRGWDLGGGRKVLKVSWTLQGIVPGFHGTFGQSN